MHITYKSAAMASLLIQLLAPMSAHAVDPQPDPAYGELLAQKWCARCHVVNSAQKNAVSVGAPSFAAIANRPGQDQKKWISNFLQSPHPPMPDPQLSRRDINDLIAYIRGQRK